MAASQTGIIRSRRRSLLVTSVPPERLRSFSIPRAGYPIPPVQLAHMVMGMCSFQIAIHDHADTVGPSAKLRWENDFGAGRRPPYLLSVPHRNAPVDLWRSDRVFNLGRYQRVAPF